jgi:hypothetical protein
MYWNSAGAEKLQYPLWLISAILAKFNRLQGPAILGGNSLLYLPDFSFPPGTINPELRLGFDRGWD